jgi:hypothetical protein
VCSKTCGGGVKTRKIITPPKNGGVSCGSLEERCNIQDCTPSGGTSSGGTSSGGTSSGGKIDCVLSDWGEYTIKMDNNSSKCVRTRTVITPAKNGGASCGSLEEIYHPSECRTISTGGGNIQNELPQASPVSPKCSYPTTTTNKIPETEFKRVEIENYTSTSKYMSLKNII